MNFKPAHFESLEQRQLLSADLAITEVLANGNARTLRDGFGNSTDWIEVRNYGTSSVWLNDYFLSDDIAVPIQWQFPRQSLEPGQSVIVFATGRNEIDPAGYMHANFSLDAEGDSVVLADRNQVIDRHFANFGQQYSGVSLAVPEAIDSRTLTDRSSARWTPESQDNLDWTTADFMVDDSWHANASSIGYESVDPFVADSWQDVLTVDLQESYWVNDSFPAVQSGWDGVFVSEPTPSVASEFDGKALTIRSTNEKPLVGRSDNLCTAPVPEYTLNRLHCGYLGIANPQAGDGAELTVSGLVPGKQYHFEVWSARPQSGRAVAYSTNWHDLSTGQPIVIAEQFRPIQRAEPLTDNLFRLTFSATANDAGQIVIVNEFASSATPEIAPLINGVRIRSVGAEPYFETDVQDQMHGQATSVFVRHPFWLHNQISEEDRLVLSLRYDAGYVGYLNGVEVVRSHVPGAIGEAVPSDSRASVENSAPNKYAEHLIDLTEFKSLIQIEQPNVLTIHALNSDPEDGDFLLAASLELVHRESHLQFVDQPTPLEVNRNSGWVGIAQKPLFDGIPGLLTHGQTVTVTAASSEELLVYTTDGSAPTLDNGVHVFASEGRVAMVQIYVHQSTVIRAVGYRTDYKMSPIVSRTYLVQQSVLQQNPLADRPSRLPTVWPTETGDFVAADYAVNTDAVGKDSLVDALGELRSVSLVISPEDAWGDPGIYAHSYRFGTEVRVGIEVHGPDGSTAANGVVEIQGNTSRLQSRTRKHSFRISFREDFQSDAELSADLFANDPGPINQLILWRPYFDARMMLKDRWLSELHQAVGGLTQPKEFVHVYLNGMYWGIYQATERLDDQFLAKRLSGRSDDYDVIKDGNAVRGNRNAWQQLIDYRYSYFGDDYYFAVQGLNSEGNRTADLPVLLDVANFIDFMLVHVLAGPDGPTDFGVLNWQAYRHRIDAETGFRFVSWDQELTLGSDIYDGFDVGGDIAGLFYSSMNSPEFQVQFADRYWELVSGVASEQHAIRIWNQLINEMKPAIPAEMARWTEVFADYSYSQWQQDVQHVAENIIPTHWNGSARFLTELYDSRLATYFARPTMTINEQGHVSLAFESETAGEIYYAINQDPRVNAAALKYESPLVLDADSEVFVRFRDVNGKWSAVLRYSSSEMIRRADANSVRITEIHYHPTDIAADTEFVEIMNISDTPIRVDQLRLVDGVAFDFANSPIQILRPDERLVVVQDEQAFRQTHPDPSILVAGEYDGALSNQGEQVLLSDRAGNVLQAVAYGDQPPWPYRADGGGFSLQRIDIDGWANNSQRWRASAVIGGTPGRSEFLVGDANLDGVFDSSDLVLVWQAGEYQDAIPQNSNWQDGDWNSDGEFTSADMVLAFQHSVYRI